MLRLHALRLSKNLTKVGLAEKTGIGRAAIRHFESGRMNPTHDELNKLAEVLGCPASALLHHIDESLFRPSGAEHRIDRED